MSLKLSLITGNSIIDKKRFEAANPNALSEYIDGLFTDFHLHLLREKLDGFILRTDTRPHRIDENFFHFTNVEVYDLINTEKPIETVNILTDVSGDKLKFLVYPNSSGASYDINQNKVDGQKRTDALKAICRALFTLNGSLLIDQDIESEDKAETRIPHSKFFMWRRGKGLLPRLEGSLNSLPVHRFLDDGECIEVCVLDQPFAHSCFNSQDDFREPGASPFGRYKEAVARVLFDVTGAEKKTRYRPWAFTYSLSEPFRRNFSNN